MKSTCRESRFVELKKNKREKEIEQVKQIDQNIVNNNVNNMNMNVGIHQKYPNKFCKRRRTRIKDPCIRNKPYRHIQIDIEVDLLDEMNFVGRHSAHIFPIECKHE